VPAIHLIVGSDDNFVYGGDEFWTWLEQVRAKMGKSKQKADDAQYATIKEGRLDILTKLRDSWADKGIRAQLDVVPGAAHESAKALPYVLDFLEPCVRRFQETLRS
jgi:major membrane immunogen (membrane-anchored lipoprotein)